MYVVKERYIFNRKNNAQKYNTITLNPYRFANNYGGVIDIAKSVKGTK